MDLSAFAANNAGPAWSDPGWTWGETSKDLSVAYDPAGNPDVYVLIGPGGHLRYHNSVPVSTMPSSSPPEPSPDTRRSPSPLRLAPPPPPPPPPFRDPHAPPVGAVQAHSQRLGGAIPRRGCGTNADREGRRAAGCKTSGGTLWAFCRERRGHQARAFTQPS